MKTVRILGASRNSRELPKERPEGVELWLANSPTTTLLRCPRAMTQWTRWFNLHSKQHILGTYPSAYHYFQNKAEGRPIYLLKQQPDVPTSIAFPYKQIQDFFAVDGKPNRYFTCSITWLIAFAIFEGFERIELWGFELRDTKPGSAFAWERPCVAYWIKQAQDHGVEVFYQCAISKLYEAGKMIPGDPTEYKDKLYGFSTKPEPDWDLEKEDWKPTEIKD